MSSPAQINQGLMYQSQPSEGEQSMMGQRLKQARLVAQRVAKTEMPDPCLSYIKEGAATLKGIPGSYTMPPHGFVKPLHQ